MVKFLKDEYVIEVREGKIEEREVTVISIPLGCIELYQLLKNYQEDEEFPVIMTTTNVLIHAMEEFELDIIDLNPVMRFFTKDCMWEFDIEQMTLKQIEIWHYIFADESKIGKCQIVNRRTKIRVALMEDDVRVSGDIDMVDREALRKLLIPDRLRSLK